MDCTIPWTSSPFLNHHHLVVICVIFFQPPTKTSKSKIFLAIRTNRKWYPWDFSNGGFQPLMQYHLPTACDQSTSFSNGKFGYPWGSTLNLYHHVPTIYQIEPHEAVPEVSKR